MTNMIQVTIACPVALIGAANQLARCIGYTEADGETFTLAQVIDGYAVASGIVAPEFVGDAVAPLVEPEWGADMTAAADAQAAIRIWSEEDPVTVGPDHIVAVVGIDPPAARALIGLGGVDD